MRSYVARVSGCELGHDPPEGRTLFASGRRPGLCSCRTRNVYVFVRVSSPRRKRRLDQGCANKSDICWIFYDGVWQARGNIHARSGWMWNVVKRYLQINRHQEAFFFRLQGALSLVRFLSIVLQTWCVSSLIRVSFYKLHVTLLGDLEGRQSIRQSSVSILNLSFFFVCKRPKPLATETVWLEYLFLIEWISYRKRDIQWLWCW